MRILLQRLAAVVVLLSWAQVSSAQTADEVIESSPIRQFVDAESR